MTSPQPGESFLAKLRRSVIGLPRHTKRLVLVIGDFLLISVALWLLVSLRLGEYYWPDLWQQGLLFLLAPILAVLIFANFGLYRVVTRFIGLRGFVQIFLLMGLSVLIWALVVFMFGQLGYPRSIIIPFALLGATLVAFTRAAMGWLLRSAGVRIPVFNHRRATKKVAIFGAGELGAELLKAVWRAGDRDVVAFFDGTPSLRGQYVGGVKVYAPRRLQHVLERFGIEEVLVALPHRQRRERRSVLRELEQLPVAVKVLPDYEDVTSGGVGISHLRPVEVSDLLGREPVKPDAELLARAILGRSILITGAGGSIGSELARQILRQGPRTLVLLDNSETALYEIEQEMAEMAARLAEDAPRSAVHAVLGSVLDRATVSESIARHAVDTVYHAAAYKHVPIVQLNAIAGVMNNTFGALVVAEEAQRLGVERVILISTDKAVRPTNVMGASKRLAELVLQGMAAESNGTIFSMVRFGNVLDSSGSVVPRFRSQIAKGGPVTVTHKSIVRYFMSIPEAAELVIQAGAMARGGEVFVLQMGDPVKIEDLARLMIHISGLTVKDEKNPDGDIEIVYSGLRPGEKLDEELLIGTDMTLTEHPRIMRSNEPCLSSDVLKRELDLMQSALSARDIVVLEAALARTVEGYVPTLSRSAHVTGESQDAERRQVSGG